MRNNYPELTALAGFPFPVYSSAGTEARAGQIARRCELAHHFLMKTLDTRTNIGVVVLAPEHWHLYASYPLYGMPHCLDADTLVVAAENNEFWQTMAPPLEGLPPQSLQAARTVYGRADGSLDYSPFFDLLAVHEMGHLFHYQAALQFPRLWLMEFFCNLCLHAYIASVEPEQLPALVTFPQLIVDGGNSHLQHRSLQDFERLYVKVGPQNYGWYQSQLLVAAKEIYETCSITTLQRLWKAFVQTNITLTDEELALRLRHDVHSEVEQMTVAWPK
jgi:hypothetical protein